MCAFCGVVFCHICFGCVVLRMLRGCGNYPGLDDGWYRTAVRTEEENSRLLAALEEVLG